MSRPQPAIVTTRIGKVEGDFQDGLYVFKGIPYAAPPVGKLRWMPPQPIKPWAGVRQVKKFGPIAPQNLLAIGPLEDVSEVEPQSEDCLFLNIRTPGLDNKKRPVMFWIHGGGYVSGSGSSISYDNGSLAARGDIVLVTMNYRLGELGFLRLKDVTGGKIPATGNEGLMDQMFALGWVKDNIEAFGGDPDNITVFGESAGGMSIGCLLAMPPAKGLFHKAICESGVGSTAVSLKTANAVSENFLKLLNFDGSDVRVIRALTIRQILDIDAQLKILMTKPGESPKITVTAPVIDGENIPDVPNKVARQGSAKDIPVIIGNNRDEMKLGLMQPGVAQMDETKLTKRLATMILPEHVPAVIEGYRKVLEKRGVKPTVQELLSAIQTNIMFRIPATELIEAQRDNGQRAYCYLFDWVSPVMDGMLGACHTLEIGFVFGNYNSERLCGSGPEADRLSRCIQDAWLAFAHTGDPSCESIGKWPVYGSNRATMILGKDCHVEEAPFEEERPIWVNVKRLEAML